MTDNKDMKIVFAPGCFDNFEGSQEDLDKLIAEVQSMFEGKSREELEAMSRPLDADDLEDLPPEIQEQLVEAAFGIPPQIKRNLQ